MMVSELMKVEDDKARASLPEAIVRYIESVRSCEHGTILVTTGPSSTLSVNSKRP